MISLIPIPKTCKEFSGKFVISKNQNIKSDFELPLVKNERSDNANLIIQKDDSIAKEGYLLDVKSDKITIKASTEIGAYYALQSIRQLAKTDLGKFDVPCCHIEDEPRFSWRGLSQDVSRHFFGVDVMKQRLDMMFMHKLNVLHWHLTDDQGWRIEIKKYPRLTEIGSKRKNSQINGWQLTQMEEKPYEGFYTQEDIKDIVSYAKARGIMIVPEIDFPAHCAAAIAAYNDLACRTLDREVPGYFGGNVPEKLYGIKDWNRTICVGKQSTFDFIYGVLDEICELFDAPYVHIGGDEAPKDEWKKCPNCQKVMKDNNLANEEDLQGWFNNQIASYLKSKGKSLIGWNEVLAAKNLSKNTVVQYWTPQRDKKAEKFVNSGGKMIMSNHQSFYFDMSYAQRTLKATYTYKPQKFGVNENNIDNILGVEGEIWTEWIRDVNRLNFMTYPRMEALSEVAWSFDENKNWKDFKARLDDFKPTLDAMGINYAVDKISLPKNPIMRAKIQKKFYGGDTELENRLNDEYKAKGAK